MEDEDMGKDTGYGKYLPDDTLGEAITRRKKRTRQSAFAVLLFSVVSGLGKLTWDLNQLVSKNEIDKQDVVKPSADYIREICRNEFKSEVERLERQNEQTRKDFERSLDQVIKYYGRVR